MKSILKIIFLLSTILFFTCQDNDSTIIGTDGGFFSGTIIMYDLLGATQKEGSIQLTQTNSTDLEGNLSFSNGENGKLVGSINDQKVELNLNPDFIDNNIFMFGNIGGKRINGDWIKTGIMGIIDKGTFIATSY